MKNLLLFFAFSILSTTAALSQSNENYQVFIMNDSFLHAQPKESKIIPLKYQLSNPSGFKFDCSGYDFSAIRSLNDGKDPDAIFIIANSGTYKVKLNTKGETVIDKSTMEPIDKPTKKFKGFEKEDTPLLGIGTLKITDEKTNMNAYWISMIEVK